MHFSELGLSAALVQAVEKAGYTTATPVQQQAIPQALQGADLLVSSHTGSGKTAAFLLPSLQRLAEPSAQQGHGPRVLVLAPTRELALQVNQAALTYGRGLRRLRTACLVGGASYTQQLRQLKDPVDVVVATPGRLIDHLERGRIDFARLEVLVLDEADRMLDMGFVDDIEAIVARTPASRQTLLFSATLDGVVGKLAAKLTRDPQRIEIASSPAAKANIEQRLLFADNFAHKNKLLDHLLRDVDLNQAVVFTATKRSAETISVTLREQGFAADALHGDLRQHERNRTLRKLRDGQIRILVATDVAARGIDVAGITHVINFDPPRVAEDYVHRIGRTGRAGRSGFAWTLADGSERGLIRGIERFTGERLQLETIPGLEPTKRERPQRPEGERGGFRGRSRTGEGGAPRSRPQGNGGGFSRARTEGSPRPEHAPSGERTAAAPRETEGEPNGNTWRPEHAPRTYGWEPTLQQASREGGEKRFGGKPGGLGGKPSGFGGKPGGFGGKPSSFGGKPGGFAGKPGGSFSGKPGGSKPGGFGGKPAGRTFTGERRHFEGHGEGHGPGRDRSRGEDR